MRIVHVLRKPLEGTVAANTLKHGCGALNIGKCRIHGGPSQGGASSGKEAFGQGSGWNRTNIYVQDIGRWPANLILQRDPGWRDDGVDASRFFTRAASRDALLRHLADLISPTHLCDCIVLGVFGDGLDLAAMDPESAHGAVVDVDGPPVRVLDRVLKPGAHVLLISPDGDPTGHAGAIAFEDAGFEVRDAILVIDAPEDRTHYVSKPSRREREAGCFALPCVTGAAAVEREEGSAGTRSPRAGAGRTADEVRNRHPTVKPVEIMERLLMDVPTDAPVIDPFMGSGTTMVACLRTGHDGIGIERDPSYIPIADARVRHWDRDVAGWSPVRIESDVEPQPEEAAEVSLADLLGL